MYIVHVCVRFEKAACCVSCRSPRLVPDEDSAADPMSGLLEGETTKTAPIQVSSRVGCGCMVFECCLLVCLFVCCF